MIRKTTTTTTTKSYYPDISGSLFQRVDRIESRIEGTRTCAINVRHEWNCRLPSFSYCWWSFSSTISYLLSFLLDFTGGSDSKASAYNAGDLGWEDLLKKEMPTHSSILAWKIPWTEEPGRLQSMGLQRVRPDWATSLSFLSFLTPPVSNSSCLFTWCQPLYASCCTVLLYFSRCYTVRLKMFSLFCVCFLCFFFYVKNTIKPITVPYCIADCVSQVPRLTLLDLQTHWTYECALRRNLFIYRGLTCMLVSSL